MTISKKEKARLQQINEHVSNGTFVPADLLNVKLTFKPSQTKQALIKRLSTKRLPKNYKVPNTPYSRIKDKNTVHHKSVSRLLDRKWLKGHMDGYFRPNIKNLIVDIANNIGIYDLRVNVFFFMLDIQDACFAITLYTKEYKYIGDLLFMRNGIDVISEMQKINFDDPTQMLPSSLITLDTDKFSFRLRIDYRECDKYLSTHSQSKLTSSISCAMDLLDIYCPNISIRNKRYPFQMDFYVTDNVTCHMNHYYKISYHNGHKINITNFDENQEIEFIKSLVSLKIITLDIEEDELTIENIIHIRQLCKLMNY